VRRPFSVSAIGGFLVVWNAVLLLVAPAEGLIRIIYVVLGVGILSGRNWARLGYLFVAPILLTANLVLGTIRLGAVNIVDRLPSFVITLAFMTILLRPVIRVWFLGTPLDTPVLPSPATAKRVWLTPGRAFSVVTATLLMVFLFLVNQFVRVARPGAERSMGIIEYYLFR
jgi:hypothetical protein